MANIMNAGAISSSNVNEFTQVMERIGHAIMGALGGFFILALVAKANIVEINSVGVLFSVILYGSIGFYLGTNIPSLPSGAPYDSVSDSVSSPWKNPYPLMNATGTLLAAVTALVSVSMIVFDEVPPEIWNIGIASCWVLGVLLKLVAGAAARLGKFTFSF